MERFRGLDGCPRTFCVEFARSYVRDRQHWNRACLPIAQLAAPKAN
jgi:hypothetical protein